MPDGKEELCRKLQEFDQQHVLNWWNELPPHEQSQLLEQLAAVDLELIDRLFRQARSEKPLAWDPRYIEPIEPAAVGDREAELARLGKQALAEGKVAVLLVAGGVGTRLGYEGPKGTFPLLPKSRRTLFHLHCEKVARLRQESQQPIPLLVMTSAATDAATREFFRSHGYFGLPPCDVLFFKQGAMPAVDRETGKLLMASKGSLALSPDGHGGVLAALRNAGMFDELDRRGIGQLFYFQVDNPLVKIADPVFLGLHLEASAQVSTKAIPKHDPGERVGNLVLYQGKCTIIEYSDLDPRLAAARDERGRLRLRLGNTAIHIFDVAFLRQCAADDRRLPYHIARKKVSHLAADGRWVVPEAENAYKFEKFVFDILPHAQRWTVVETKIQEEYAPLKNREGTHSPDWVRKRLLEHGIR